MKPTLSWGRGFQIKSLHEEHQQKGLGEVIINAATINGYFSCAD